MEQKDNLVGVLSTLYQWRKPVLIVCGVAAVGSVIISLLLPVYYRSATLFLAASPDQAQPELLFSDGTMRAQVYGNENDLDRLLTIAESSELEDYLVDRFGLYAHYDIDSTHPKASHYVRLELRDLYNVKKTTRDDIELVVEDRDRHFSAEMANAAREKIDELARQLMKENQLKAIKSYKNSIRDKEKFLREIGDSLVELRQRYRIYNSGAQSESLTAQYSEAESKLVRNRARLAVLTENRTVPRDTIAYVRALVSGLSEEVDSLASRLSMLNRGMPTVEILQRQYFEANDALSKEKERFKKLQATYEADIPATILVERATPPVIKSRPKRSILVLVSVAIAFFFSLVGVLLLENYKHINWREVVNAK